jgi:hypothetical protein
MSCICGVQNKSQMKLHMIVVTLKVTVVGERKVLSWIFREVVCEDVDAIKKAEIQV